MELEKIRNQTDDELKQTELSAAEQIFRIRFQKSLGNQEGLKKLRTLKLDIARAKTIRREREIAAHNHAHPEPKAAAPASSQRTARKHARKV